jgi:L-lactate utilization protein LutC
MNTREKFLAELKAKKEAQRAEEAEALSKANAAKALKEKLNNERIAAKMERIARGGKTKPTKTKKTTAKKPTTKRGRPKKTS